MQSQNGPELARPRGLHLEDGLHVEVHARHHDIPEEFPVDTNNCFANVLLL